MPDVAYSNIALPNLKLTGNFYLFDCSFPQTVTLGSGQNYYLVVDHTPVGAANGNDGQFNRVDFTWYFEGIGDAELGQSINTNPVINSAAQSAPAALLIACLCALLALVQ